MARKRGDGQVAFRFKGWGGRREGAGRPRKAGAKLRHGPRAPLAPRLPALATLRTVPGAPNLRRGAVYLALESSIAAGRRRAPFRVVHFTAIGNHLHLVVEAAGTEALSRGMQGLAIRIARRVNRAAGRAGRLWGDRYHARVLRTPREVRAALCYVLQNARRHARDERRMIDPGWVDPRSSGAWFDGWAGDVQPPPAASIAPVSEPRTWLLATGWRRAGLIRVDEVPAAALTPPPSSRAG